jgi:hypothetical protein
MDVGNPLAGDLKLLNLARQSVVGMRNSHPVDFKFSLGYFQWLVACYLLATQAMASGVDR